MQEGVVKRQAVLSDDQQVCTSRSVHLRLRGAHARGGHADGGLVGQPGCAMEQGSGAARDLGKQRRACLNVWVAYGRSVQRDAFPNRRTETLRPL